MRIISAHKLSSSESKSAISLVVGSGGGIFDSLLCREVRNIMDSKACATKAASLYSPLLVRMQLSLELKSLVTFCARMTEAHVDSSVKDWMSRVRP